MKNYQYQILRYVHDQFTGEFVNLGIVVYSPEEQFLQAIVIKKYSRITALFPKANGNFILKTIRNFESALKSYSKQLTGFDKPSNSLSAITGSILPNDDSAIMLTEVKYAIDIDMDIALHDLYARLIEKYIQNENAIQTLSDKDVWTKKYKSYFDKYNVTNRLTSHKIHTKYDDFDFKKSWKNEIWHCYEPISFDLINEESIKDKVYKWTGKLKEIEKTNEKIHITFLAKFPTHHKNLDSLIKDALLQETDTIDVDLVLESGAENLAKEVCKLMDEHTV